MNNGRAILAAQEEPGSIELLAAQRQLYSEAKAWKAVQFVCSLVVPLAVTAVQMRGFLPVDSRWCIPAGAILGVVPIAISESVKRKRASAVRETMNNSQERQSP